MISHSYQIELENYQKFLIKLDDKVAYLTFAAKNLLTKTLVVIDEEGKLEGTISDGDLRKYAEENFVSPILVSHAMNKDPYVLSMDRVNDHEYISNLNFSRGLFPVVDADNFVVGVCYATENYIPDSRIYRKITAVAPTRISFGGGGSDVEDWFISNNGLVINAALSKFARVSLQENNSTKISVQSLNSAEKWVVDKNDRSDWPDNLIFNCIRQFNFTTGLDIKIFCDFDIGTGLGGSSSLCVALLKGLAELRALALSNEELMHLAYYTERRVCKINGGWQDQVAAVYGGILRIKFNSSEIMPIKLDIQQHLLDQLNSSMFLVRVGESRESSRIHDEMSISLKNDQKYANRMLKIIELADRAEKILTGTHFEQLGALLDRSWQIKAKLTKNITNNSVQHLYQKLLEFGATGGKLLGAGGSGYLLIWVDSRKQLQFLENTSSEGFCVERVNIDYGGARVLYD